METQVKDNIFLLLQFSLPGNDKLIKLQIYHSYSETPEDIKSFPPFMDNVILHPMGKKETNCYMPFSSLRILQGPLVHPIPHPLLNTTLNFSGFIINNKSFRGTES